MLPPLLLAELRQPMFNVSSAGVVNLAMGIPEVVLRFMGKLLLPATLSGGLPGWRLGRTKRAAWSTALAGFVFALGPGHNIPFIGGTPGRGQGSGYHGDHHARRCPGAGRRARLAAAAGGAGEGLSSAFTLVIGWGFLNNGAIAVAAAPPPSAAFPYQDITHFGSLAFGGLAAYATWWEMRRRSVPFERQSIFIAVALMIVAMGMSDDDLHAIWLYLQNLPPLAVD